MAFGFTCPDLTGASQTIGALETPAFVRTIDVAGVPGSRVWFQGVAPGVAPYASSTITRAAMVAGLVGAGADFTPVDFLDLEGVTVTINGDGEIASIVAIAPELLPLTIPAGCRLTFSSGIYCDVQGTVAAVTAALTAGGGGSVPIVGPLATVYVEPAAPAGRGNDATGQRGNAARPFATLTAGLAAMLSGDTLELANGANYAPPAGPIPAGLTNGQIIASSGPAATKISGIGTGLACLDFSGGARTFWTLDGVQLENDPGVPALVADGTGLPPGAMFSGVFLWTRGVVAGGDVLLKYAATVIVDEYLDVADVGGWVLTSCRSVLFGEALFFSPSRTMVIDQDNDDVNRPPPQPPLPPTQQLDPVRFASGCVWNGGQITLMKQGSIIGAPGTILPVITGDGLTISAAPLFRRSEIVLYGRIAAIDFISAPPKLLPDAPYVIDCAGATFIGPVGVSLALGAVSVARLTAIGASFGVSVTLGEGFIGNLRDAFFVSGPLLSIFTVGTNGRVVPPTFAVGPVPAALPTTALGFPFRLAGVDYAVAVDADSVGAQPAATTTRTITGIEITPTAAAGTLRAIVNYYGSP